jgi:hypothetical protein
MAIKQKAHRQVKHPFEHMPPHQERYDHGPLETTACPLHSSKVSTMDNSAVMSNAAKLQYPSPNLEHDSPNLFHSTTNGKDRR